MLFFAGPIIVIIIMSIIELRYILIDRTYNHYNFAEVKKIRNKNRLKIYIPLIILGSIIYPIIIQQQLVLPLIKNIIRALIN